MKNHLFVSVIIFCVFACKKDNSAPVTTASPVDSLMLWTKSAHLYSAINDIWFTNANEGFILNGAYISSSQDGGVTWLTGENSTNFNLQFLSDQIGFAQGINSLQITEDGGKTWQSASLPGSKAYYFQFVTREVGFFQDYNTGLFKTADGGITWNSIFQPQATPQLMPFYFLDSLHGFTMMDGNFSKTIDGGLNWELVSTSVTPNAGIPGYFRMQMLDSLNGYCGTSRGLLKTTDGKTWNNVLSDSATFMIMQFFDANHGYVTNYGKIYKTTDGGLHWTLSCSLAADEISGICFLDMDHGWASSFKGYVLTLK